MRWRRGTRRPRPAGAAPGGARPCSSSWAQTGCRSPAGSTGCPAGSDPGPAMLSLHGGPEAQERPVFSAQHQAMAAAGIAVFAPNIRGSSGFGRAFVHADDVHGRRDAFDDVLACPAVPGRPGGSRPGPDRGHRALVRGLPDPGHAGVLSGQLQPPASTSAACRTCSPSTATPSRGSPPRRRPSTAIPSTTRRCCGRCPRSTGSTTSTCRCWWCTASWTPTCRSARRAGGRGAARARPAGGVSAARRRGARVSPGRVAPALITRMLQFLTGPWSAGRA